MFHFIIISIFDSAASCQSVKTYISLPMYNIKYDTYMFENNWYSPRVITSDENIEDMVLIWKADGISW